MLPLRHRPRVIARKQAARHEGAQQAVAAPVCTAAMAYSSSPIAARRFVVDDNSVLPKEATVSLQVMQVALCSRNHRFFKL
jgi:hypothetical protein